MCVSHDFAHEVLPWQLPPLDLHEKLSASAALKCGVSVFYLSSVKHRYGWFGFSGTEKQNHVEYL